MEIRPLTETYAVSPQIALEDVAALKTAGFTIVIDNRPDAEIPAPIHAAAMRAAVLAAGMDFVDNPVVSGQITQDNVDIQRDAIDRGVASGGKVFAYCASGNRSSVIWALANAGRESADVLIAIPARHGYQLEWLRPTLEAAQG